jgi:hypothetical protein
VQTAALRVPPHFQASARRVPATHQQIRNGRRQVRRQEAQHRARLQYAPHYELVAVAQGLGLARLRRTATTQRTHSGLAVGCGGSAPRVPWLPLRARAPPRDHACTFERPREGATAADAARIFSVLRCARAGEAARRLLAPIALQVPYSRPACAASHSSHVTHATTAAARRGRAAGASAPSTPASGAGGAATPRSAAALLFFFMAGVTRSGVTAARSVHLQPRCVLGACADSDALVKLACH